MMRVLVWVMAELFWTSVAQQAELGSSVQTPMELSSHLSLSLATAALSNLRVSCTRMFCEINQRAHLASHFADRSPLPFFSAAAFRSFVACCVVICPLPCSSAACAHFTLSRESASLRCCLMQSIVSGLSTAASTGLLAACYVVGLLLPFGAVVLCLFIVTAYGITGSADDAIVY